MRTLIVVPTVVLAVVAGCAKVAPQAGRAIVNGEKAAAKLAPAAVGQAGSNTSHSVARQAGVWSARAATAAEAYDRYEQLAATPAEAPPERFPYPASSVKPIANQPIILNQAGAYALPNNYGGFNLYDAAGRPLGFSAWNLTRREERYFDPFGNGL
jgi:hypothetical protein